MSEKKTSWEELLLPRCARSSTVSGDKVIAEAILTNQPLKALERLKALRDVPGRAAYLPLNQAAGTILREFPYLG